MALWSTCAVVQKPLPEKMLKLDHLTIVAPSLERGAAHVRQQLGVEMQRGGKHPEMGTHNCLLRLGEGTFLEVIAPDPEAPPPTRARWFGLDDVDGIERAWARGDCLTAWVAQTRDLTGLLERHGRVLGRSIRVSRGDRCWHISIPDDGALPCGGSAPSAIDWGDRGSPATEMTDLGCRLLSFVVEHPDPAFLCQLYSDLGIVDHPFIRQAAKLRYRAVIATPSGHRELG